MNAHPQCHHRPPGHSRPLVGADEAFRSRFVLGDSAPPTTGADGPAPLPQRAVASSLALYIREHTIIQSLPSIAAGLLSSRLALVSLPAMHCTPTLAASSRGGRVKPSRVRRSGGPGLVSLSLCCCSERVLCWTVMQVACRKSQIARWVAVDLDKSKLSRAQTPASTMNVGRTCTVQNDGRQRRRDLH